ncbi:MAG: response regulator [Deltaproteobacteria bacterium]|nr:response regulator [Deltaproteobacteria bacterium]
MPLREPGRVLVAEDHADSAALIEAMLRAGGYEVSVVGDGIEAIEFLQHHEVDLVITDLDMPRLDGLSLARHLAKENPDLPVVATTAHALVRFRAEAAEAGVRLFLTKPLQKDGMLAAIGEVLGGPTGGALNFPQGVVHVDPDIADLVPRFLAHRKAEAAEMRRAYQDQDFETLQRLGHDLRGCAPGYGFAELGRLGALLETAASSADLLSTAEVIAQVEARLASVRWMPDASLGGDPCMDW